MRHAVELVQANLSWRTAAAAAAAATVGQLKIKVGARARRAK